MKYSSQFFLHRVSDIESMRCVQLTTAAVSPDTHGYSCMSGKCSCDLRVFSQSVDFFEIPFGQLKSES